MKTPYSPIRENFLNNIQNYAAEHHIGIRSSVDSFSLNSTSYPRLLLLLDNRQRMAVSDKDPGYEVGTEFILRELFKVVIKRVVYGVKTKFIPSKKDLNFHTCKLIP